MTINWIRMAETRGQADGGRSSATARRPVATPSSRWEMNLGDEEMMSPNRQAGNAPPEDRVPREEHVGEHVRSLARDLSDLADTKLNATASIGRVPPAQPM